MFHLDLIFFNLVMLPEINQSSYPYYYQILLSKQKMCKRQTLTCIVILFTIFYSCPASDIYSLKQTLDQMYEEVFYYGISGIDITDDNSILALACYDHFTYVYSLSQTDSFDFEEKHSCQSAVEYVELTGDGQKMMMVCQHENNILMEKKKNKISYKALLEFGLSGQYVYGGALSKDGKILVDTNIIGEIFIYKYDESQSKYISLSNFTLDDVFITHAEISADSSFIVISSDTQNLQVFKFNDEQNTYEEHQTIEIKNGWINKRASITSDHQYILTNDYDEDYDEYLCSIFAYNQESKQYSLLNSIKLLGYQESIYCSLSQNQNYLVISLHSGTKLYLDPLGTPQLEQQFKYSLFHKFSKDEKYLFLGNEGQAEVYAINEEFYCNTTNDSNLFYKKDIQKCQICVEFCLQCLSEDFCSVCDESQNYFKVSGNCVQCDIENCQTCQSVDRCQQCDDGYQIDGNDCTEIIEQEEFNLLPLVIVLPIVVVISLLILTLLFCFKGKFSKINDESMQPKKFQGNPETNEKIEEKVENM